MMHETHRPVRSPMARARIPAGRGMPFGVAVLRNKALPYFRSDLGRGTGVTESCHGKWVKPLSVFRFALSVFRCKTGPPGVPYTPGCSVAVRLPLGVPLPSGPPRCSVVFRLPSMFRSRCMCGCSVVCCRVCELLARVHGMLLSVRSGSKISSTIHF